MGAYQDHLEHVVEPASPTERDDAVSATIEDYEALWLSDILREHAHYADHDYEDEGGIAVAYASYIDQKIRDEGESRVRLYAHTQAAIETLLNTILRHRGNDHENRNYPVSLFNSVESEFADAFIEDEEDSNT